MQIRGESGSSSFQLLWPLLDGHLSPGLYPLNSDSGDSRGLEKPVLQVGFCDGVALGWYAFLGNTSNGKQNYMMFTIFNANINNQSSLLIMMSVTIIYQWLLYSGSLIRKLLYLQLWKVSVIIHTFYLRKLRLRGGNILLKVETEIINQLGSSLFFPLCNMAAHSLL